MRAVSCGRLSFSVLVVSNYDVIVRTANFLHMLRTPQKYSDSFVEALANGLRAIEVFDTGGRSLTLTEVAEQAGLSRAASRRYLHTLCALGYAEHDGKRFKLTPRVLKLGYVFISTGPLPQLAQPILEGIVAATGMPAFLGVLDGLDVAFIARASPQSETLLVGVGGRLPAFTSSSGRVLLAAKRDAEIERMIRRAGRPRQVTLYTKTETADILREIQVARTSGYATSDKEVAVGSRSISVPVMTPSGSVAAAIALVAPARTSATAKSLQQALPMLQRASQALGSLL